MTRGIRFPMPQVVNSLYGIHTATPIGWQPGNVASATWIAVDRALYVPFYASDRFQVAAFYYLVGATVGTTETFDIGLLDATCQTVLLSTGSTTCAGGTINTPRRVTVTANQFPPGLYHLGMSMNNATTPTVTRVQASTANRAKAWGWLQAASQSPLANTPTLAVVAGDFFPLFGFSQDAGLPL